MNIRYFLYFLLFSTYNLLAMQQEAAQKKPLVVGLCRPRTKPSGMVRLKSGVFMHEKIVNKIMHKCKAVLKDNPAVVGSLFNFYVDDTYKILHEHAKILVAEGLLARDESGALKALENVREVILSSADFNYFFSMVNYFNDPTSTIQPQDILVLKSGKKVSAAFAQTIVDRCNTLLMLHGQPAVLYLLTLYKQSSKKNISKMYINLFIGSKLLDGRGQLIADARDIILSSAVIRNGVVHCFAAVEDRSDKQHRRLNGIMLLQKGGAVAKDYADTILWHCKKLWKEDRKAALALVLLYTTDSFEGLSEAYKQLFIERGLLRSDGELNEPVGSVVRSAALIDEFKNELRGFDDFDEIERIDKNNVRYLVKREEALKNIPSNFVQVFDVESFEVDRKRDVADKIEASLLPGTVNGETTMVTGTERQPVTCLSIWKSETRH
jgi:hypothetical protein